MEKIKPVIIDNVRWFGVYIHRLIISSVTLGEMLLSARYLKACFQILKLIKSQCGFGPRYVPFQSTHNGLKLINNILPVVLFALRIVMCRYRIAARGDRTYDQPVYTLPDKSIRTTPRFATYMGIFVVS